MYDEVKDRGRRMTKTYRHPIWILIILGLGGPIIFALSLYFEISVSLMVYELFYDTTHLVDLPDRKSVV